MKSESQTRFNKGVTEQEIDVGDGFEGTFHKSDEGGLLGLVPQI